MDIVELHERALDRVGGNLRAVGVAAQLGGDPAAAYRASAQALASAWREPGRLDGTYRLPFGELPGRAAVQLHLLETVMHGWDLARATGQDPSFDNVVATAAAAELAERTLAGTRPPGTPFKQAVAAPDGASPVDRLAAFLGRQP
jgi:uncharacterized protein (TIGR03086 family)